MKGPILRQTARGDWRLACKARCGHIVYSHFDEAPDADEELAARREWRGQLCEACRLRDCRIRKG